MVVALVAIQVHLVADGWIGLAVSSCFYVSCEPALEACVGIDLYGEVVPAERLLQLAKYVKALSWLELVRCGLAGVCVDDVHFLGV